MINHVTIKVVLEGGVGRWCRKVVSEGGVGRWCRKVVLEGGVGNYTSVECMVRYWIAVY